MTRLALIKDGIVKQVIVIAEDTVIISEIANVNDIYSKEEDKFYPPLEEGEETPE